MISTVGQKIKYMDKKCPTIIKKEMLNMRCPDCKKEITSHHKDFCPHCGGELVVKNRARVIRILTPAGIQDVAL